MQERNRCAKYTILIICNNKVYFLKISDLYIRETIMTRVASKSWVLTNTRLEQFNNGVSYKTLKFKY